MIELIASLDWYFIGQIVSVGVAGIIFGYSTGYTDGAIAGYEARKKEEVSP